MIRKIFAKDRLVFLVFYFIVSVTVSAKTPNGESVFTNDTIHEIRINFPTPKSWDTLLVHYEKFHENEIADTNFVLAVIRIDGVLIDSVGVKMKSNFSFTIPSGKKPLKLDFNAFKKKQYFDGLRALNLSNEFPDPSMLRNTLVYKIFRDAGIIAPRTAFAKVYIDDIYKGLYVMIEQIDKSYISRHFDFTGGELVKPSSTSIFYEPLDTEHFKSNYIIKIKNIPATWDHLFDLAKRINTTTADVYYDSLKNIFDFPSYISVFASDIIFNNWDSYFYGQNYYLYRDSCENKYYFLPWDYNISMNNYSVSGGDYPILPAGYNSSAFQLPLPSKIIANPYLRKKYLQELCRINSLMNADSLSPFIHKMHNMIRGALKEDPGKIFTMEQYEQSLNRRTGISEIEFEGLISFIRYRHKMVDDMLKAEKVDCRK